MYFICDLCARKTGAALVRFYSAAIRCCEYYGFVFMFICIYELPIKV